MNKIEIYDKEYNVSKKVYYHIKGLETENRLFSMEIKGHEENEIKLQKRLNKAIEYLEYNDVSLYTFEPDYDYEENIVDNYEPTSYREDLLKILKSDSNG